ncbi:reverse transcriptase domain-containing protein [Pseudomonas syringae]|uniref:reverse transcriptase domain-containing protein n=1 Tax=Pseudomonas syringae TaxID=317 RepID=UPI0004277470|nr:reverse transcriptase domain-containing protein [Pseudomonas syringae]
MNQDTDAILYAQGFITDDELFRRMFSANSLIFTYRERFKSSLAKGLDRINGFQYSARSENALQVVADKCLNGTFRFTPFLEKLKLKGRGKAPRIIGIPTVRDRVVLHQLHRYLALLFPDNVPKNVASTYVRSVAEDMVDLQGSKTWICCTDIEKFYDSIQQERLLKLLARKIKCDQVLSLVGHALQTPTVPQNCRRNFYSSYRQEYGVPQGLAISNILASIYMAEVDGHMSSIPGLTYYRYVDDVLMYGSEVAVTKAYDSVRRRLSRRGLTLHGRNSSKTHLGPISERFSYLGYDFLLPLITVRNETFERFLQAVAAKVSDFKHNFAKRLEKHKYLDQERLIDIFYLELNEKITGAISGNKRYGWMAYFNQITDEKLLHQMDFAVARMVSRVPLLVMEGAPSLKKLVRAHHELKFNLRGGYIRDYDLNISVAQKLRFLDARGRVDPDVALTDAQINERYESYVKFVLAKMYADEGEIY